jgi:hypothetical protein
VGETGWVVSVWLSPEPMDDQAKQKRAYRMLAVVFAVAGVIWIVYGFFSPRFILYPLIGLLNLGIAYVCKQLSA